MKIKGTAVKSPDVLVAKLAGAVRAQVVIVRTGEEFHFVAPERLGGTQEVPADSLTDCLNYSVWEMNEKVRRGARRRRK